MAPSSTAPVRAAEAPLHLLVEDDEGDAFLVRELLADAAPEPRRRDRALARRRRERRSAPFSDCVLLDLGLPDTTGLYGLVRLRPGARPRPRCLVLTGHCYAQRGHGRRRRRGRRTTSSRAASTGKTLAPRHPLRDREAPRGAPPSVRLLEAELPPEENARLERGLLPTAAPARPAHHVDRRLPPRPPPRGARRRLLRRHRGRRRHAARHDRRRRRATVPTRPRSASACGSPGARSCSPAGRPPRVFETMERVLVAERPPRTSSRRSCTLDRSRPIAAAPTCGSPGHPAAVILGGAAARARRRSTPRSAWLDAPGAAGDDDRRPARRVDACCSTPTGSSRDAPAPGARAPGHRGPDGRPGPSARAAPRVGDPGRAPRRAHRPGRALNGGPHADDVAALIVSSRDR